MFGDTITMPVLGVDTVFKKVNQDDYSSEYQHRGETQKLVAKIRHSKVTRQGIVYDRHNVEVTQTIYATAEAPAIVRMGYVVFENVESDLLGRAPLGAIANWLLASSSANAIALTIWES